MHLHGGTCAWEKRRRHGHKSFGSRTGGFLTQKSAGSFMVVAQQVPPSWALLWQTFMLVCSLASSCGEERHSESCSPLKLTSIMRKRRSSFRQDCWVSWIWRKGSLSLKAKKLTCVITHKDKNNLWNRYSAGTRLNLSFFSYICYLLFIFKIWGQSFSLK